MFSAIPFGYVVPADFNNLSSRETTSSKNALSSKRKNAKSHRSEEQREAPPAMFLEKKMLGNAA